MEDTLILAIESSCDETAAAVVRNGREVLSNVISPRSISILSMAALCRRSLPGNILNGSTR